MNLNDLSEEKIKEIVNEKVNDKMSSIMAEAVGIIPAIFQHNANVAMTAGAGTNDTINVIYDSKHAKMTRSELIGKIFRSCYCEVKQTNSGSMYNVECVIKTKDPALDLTQPFVADILGQAISATKVELGYFYK